MAFWTSAPEKLTRRSYDDRRLLSARGDGAARDVRRRRLRDRRDAAGREVAPRPQRSDVVLLDDVVGVLALDDVLEVRHDVPGRDDEAPLARTHRLVLLGGQRDRLLAAAVGALAHVGALAAAGAVLVDLLVDGAEQLLVVRQPAPGQLVHGTFLQ